jgi:hypothetical protein
MSAKRIIILVIASCLADVGVVADISTSAANMVSN